MAPSLRYRFILALIILVAFAFRLHTLDANPLWFDESMEYWVATASLDSLPETVLAVLQDPPLYSTLLHIWMRIGRDEFTLRLLSTGASLLSLTAISRLATHSHSRVAGVASAVILAVSTPDIRFAQEVGQYALLGLALSLNLLALSFARQTNAWKYWAAWLLTSLLGAYVYYGSLLVIIPLAALVLLQNGLKGQWLQIRRQLLALFLFAVLAMPLLLLWLPQQLYRGPTAQAFQVTLLPLPVELSSFFSLTRDLLAFQLTGNLPMPEMWANLSFAAWLLLAVLLLIGLYSLLRSPPHSYIASWLIGSWFLYYVAGRVGLYPYGGTRHALILTPLLLWTVAIGVATLWRRRRILGPIFLLAIVTVTVIAPREAPEDLRTVVRQHLAAQDNDVPTYVYYGAVPGFRYQLALQTDTIREQDVPAGWFQACWAGTSPSLCAQDNVFYGRWIRALTPQEKREEIITVTGASERLWLIFSHTDSREENEVMSVFHESYVVLQALKATGASAYLLQAR